MKLKGLKTAGFLLGLLVIAALNIFVYLNYHLYYRAKNEEDRDERIRLLTKSNTYCPLNDLAFYELGKAHFELGLARVDDAAAGESHFRKAVENLKRCVLINPASPYAHYYLAQSLLHLDFFSPQGDSSFSGEFKKAAQLAGEDSQVYSGVGKHFFSRWPKLSEDDRRFTLDLIRKAMAGKKRDEIAAFLSIWDMNVGDYEVMKRILPEDAQIYRMYAEFLGEKALSLTERHKVLAGAEAMDFEIAQRELQLGEMALFRYQTQEALSHFQRAQELLGGIRFYQSLVAQNLIAPDDYFGLLRSVWLNLAKCRIEGGAKFDDVEEDLRRYLAMEDRPKESANLEEYLRSRGLLSERSGWDSDDLDRMAFELLLQFKQTRYRDIVSLGRGMSRSVAIIPEDKKKDYVSIQQLIGDSFQKVDYLYDAGDVYEKAREIDPGNLGTLFRIRRNCIRLNDERRLRDLEKEIDGILAPKELRYESLILQRGGAYPQNLIFDGSKISLNLEFESQGDRPAPIVSVIFNGRVVWENILQTRLVSLSLETREGENLLQIVPLNRAVSLAKLTWRRGDENKRTSP